MSERAYKELQVGQSCEGTYAFEIGLERRKNLFDRAFDEHASDQTEAFAVRVGFGCLAECVDYESARVTGEGGRRVVSYIDPSLCAEGGNSLVLISFAFELADLGSNSLKLRPSALVDLCCLCAGVKCMWEGEPCQCDLVSKFCAGGRG